MEQVCDAYPLQGRSFRAISWIKTRDVVVPPEDDADARRRRCLGAHEREEGVVAGGVVDRAEHQPVPTVSGATGMFWRRFRSGPWSNATHDHEAVVARERERAAVGEIPGTRQSSSNAAPRRFA